MPFLTLNEVAAHLRCSRRTVNRLIERGQIKVTRIGGMVRVKQSAIEKLVERWTD